MKKYIVLLFMVMLIGGCGPANKDKSALVKINNYEINKEEFEEGFKTSSFGVTDSEESRKEFLENLIDRKLILQDAQKQGLDKEASFLKAIERFWEQSLLKIALDKKSKEIAGSVSISDKEIEDRYNKMISEDKTDKSYGQMYKQIKREITKVKESQLMEDWLSDLRKKADIKIDSDLLKPR